jgi:hypothetical protein
MKREKGLIAGIVIIGILFVTATALLLFSTKRNKEMCWREATQNRVPSETMVTNEANTHQVAAGHTR